MKIGFIWDADYPWDIRVEKISNTLTNNRHEVHLICRNKKIMPCYEILDAIHIHRIPTIPIKRINNLISFPAFFNPLWVFHIFNIVRKKGLKCIIVRDITLSIPAIITGKIFKIPVLLDMAEPYPEMLRSILKYDKFKISNLIVRNPFFASLIEKITLRHIDRCWVVAEESKDRLIRLGAKKEKIDLVMNSNSR